MAAFLYPPITQITQISTYAGQLSLVIAVHSDFVNCLCFQSV